jgi:ActR/RegA family two-component response regulator
MSSRSLRVLVVAEDAQIVHAVAHVVRDEGAELFGASSVDEALAVAASTTLDVAFVEIRAASGGALALCHLLPATSPGVRVVAIAQRGEIERGEEALSLGAAGVLVAPPTGDALGRVLSDVKAETSRLHQVGALEQKLARERRRLETYDRLVRFARGAAPSDAVRAIVDGVAQLSGALGVALYATFGKEDSDRVLLAALGSALDMPASCPPADLSRLISARQARAVPLVSSAGELGLLLLDHAPPTPEPDIAQLADLAAAMLALVDKKDSAEETGRVLASRTFRALTERMLSLAGRHDRRASLLAISVPEGDRPGRREEALSAIADVVRTTDALCGAEDGDIVIFLPETTGLGAQACRRRILSRLAGDRRARPRATVVRGEPRSSKGAAFGVGVATFPHDGASLKRLVRAARARAADDGRSAVHSLSLETLPLPEVIDALIARPILDAGPRSPYPLDVACSSLFSLVARACREALRGGDAAVVSTLQPGLGVAAAARQVTSPRVLDVRGEPGCHDLEAIVIEAEHGSWVCCGRLVGDRFRGVHAADPLLADVVSRRLEAAGGPNAG